MFLIFFSLSVSCNASQQLASEEAEQKSISIEKVSTETTLGNEENHLHETSYHPELTLSSQQKKLNDLEQQINKLDNSGGMNFAVWTGILLAAVAIILTALGVVMAIFSFLGYKKIMSSVHDIATSISENVAEQVAREIAEDLTPGVTEGVLIKLFEEKRFDKVINQAVEKVIYRGIQLENDNLLEGGIE